MVKNDGIDLFRFFFYGNECLNIFGKIVLSPLLLILCTIFGIMDFLFGAYHWTDVEDKND